MFTYETICGLLAHAFMQYLDNIRPNGKMCLSNGECLDIERAFQQRDYDRIVRYYNKYIPTINIDAVYQNKGKEWTPSGETDIERLAVRYTDSVKGIPDNEYNVYFAFLAGAEEQRRLIEKSNKQ